jgi:addiction module HigA family antidote
MRSQSVSIESRLAPIHPGKFLKEALDELGTSQAEFARAIGVSPMGISDVVNGTRPVTAELALLFGRAFRQTPQYWLNLQAAYDLKAAEREIGARLRALRPLAPA